MLKRLCVFTGFATLAAGWGCSFPGVGTLSGPIKVGVLHSRTGTMAVSEQPVVDATLLAIDEINRRGGPLGRRIEPITVDGESDAPTFARQAERLILEEKVCTIFGCWTSASRKTIKPILEEHKHLLFYPVQYEGLERPTSKSNQCIVYTGAAPNQQIIPAVSWCFDNLGDRVFLVGSDYIFPRAANEIIKDQVTALRGEVLGEEYILLGSTQVEGMVAKIVEAEPDVILNTINGASNAAFFTALRRATRGRKRIPTMSFSISETELAAMGPELMVGDYAAWNYFQSIRSEANKDFVRRFKDRYGSDRVVNDPMEAAYIGVHFWAQAVRDAQSAEVEDIRQTIRSQSYQAPEGIVSIDSDNLHVWKTVRIGRARPDGQFDIIWPPASSSSARPIRPGPFPMFRRRAQWESLLEGLFEGWGKSWANPGR